MQQVTYGGMPVVVDGLRVYAQVLEERGEPFPARARRERPAPAGGGGTFTLMSATSRRAGRLDGHGQQAMPRPSPA